MIRIGNNLPVARPQARFETLPATLDLSPSRSVAVGRMLIAVFAFVAAWMVRAETGAPAPGTSATVALIVNGIPLALAAGGVLAGASGLVALLTRREARFDAAAVRVTGRTPFGGEEWSQPLSAFEGVAWRIIRQRRRRGRSRVWQVIELVHPDSARTLPLYVRESRRDARAEWEGLARALGVPAIDARHGAPHVRAPEDLDKSIRELFAEGRAGPLWQPGDDPPPGLSWQAEGEPAAGTDALVVRLHARRFPLWVYLLPAAVGAFAIYDGIADREFFAVPIGLALIAAPALYRLAEPGRPRALRITRDDVRLVDPMPFGRDAGPLRLERIEEIRVAEPRSRLVGARALVIATDAGEIRTGQGLNAGALEWLRRYLTAAVVEA